MKKKLMYVTSLMEFTDNKTGEVVSGGKVVLCDVQSYSDTSGIGMYTDIKWITPELLTKLRKGVVADKFPYDVEVVLENRGMSQKPKLVDINFI